MPKVSEFYGIEIMIYWNDHNPPHFHAFYAGNVASIDILTTEKIEGDLPGKALSLVKEWAARYKNELMEDWELCKQKQPVKKITSLV